MATVLRYALAAWLMFLAVGFFFGQVQLGWIVLAALAALAALLVDRR